VPDSRPFADLAWFVDVRRFMHEVVRFHGDPPSGGRAHIPPGEFSALAARIPKSGV
jgi:hypothetical protein